MNLNYSQSLAQFSSDENGPISSPGLWYAGGDMGLHPEGINNPQYQDMHNIGPVPQGWYTIGPAVQHTQLGPALMLTPDATNRMFLRGGFYIHCTNPKRDAGQPPYPPTPGRNSSDGCPAAVTYIEWEKIATLQADGYNRLQVIV
jgi:hypothetical protein